MNASLYKHALQSIVLWLLMIFAFFSMSGVPGFYDPYKLDGKGIDPHKYLCLTLHRGASQCDGEAYLKQVIPVAGIKTILAVLLPFASGQGKYFLYIYLPPIGIFLLLKEREKRLQKQKMNLHTNTLQ